VQALTSPGNYHDVGVFGLGYRIPLYARGDSIDVVAGYSDVDSGTVQDLFAVTGKGAVYALRYNQGLNKWRDIEHKLVYGLDYRAYQNNVNPVGGNISLVPDITVHPFSATYFASLRQEEREISVFASFVQNLPGGNDGTDDVFKKARFQVGTAGYRLFRFGGTYSRSIVNDWQGRIRVDAQYTEDALVTGEQFAIGGADNVRGFNERYTSNDKGYRTNFEIYTPDWAKLVGLTDGRLRFVGFYDTGVTYRNQPLPGEHDASSLDSVGVGLRFSHKNYFTARVDFAHVLHDGSQNTVPDGRRNLNVIHFSTAVVW
jgi:hemolysin activation/secretion protein